MGFEYQLKCKKLTFNAVDVLGVGRKPLSVLNGILLCVLPTGSLDN